MIVKKNWILSWKEKFDGDIDKDELLNYVFPHLFSLLIQILV